MNLTDKYLKILKVIDMQIDFLTGILKNPSAEAIIDAVIAEIEAWDGIIIATRDTHFDDDSYYQSIEGKRLPIHCVHGTPGWEIEPRIMAALKKKGAIIVDKHNFGFINWPKVMFDIDSTDQDAVAALTRGKNIVIRYTGTCTDICDSSNWAIDRAWFPDARIEVVDGATAACYINAEQNKQSQEAALTLARAMLCDVVRPVFYKGAV